MEDLENQLLESIEELNNAEILKLQIQFAKFNKILQEDYKNKIKAIQENMDSQIQFYGKKLDDYQNVSMNIVQKYTEEFQKIYNQRKEQFFNILSEIQEIEANQKVAIANMNTMIRQKKKMVEGSQYREYIHKKEEFQKIVDNTLKHEEFDKYTALLEELRDPLEICDKKLEALAKKYDEYEAIIIECENKLEDCIKAAQEDFIEIVRFRNTSVAVMQKANPIRIFIQKIANLFVGNAKFEKDVVQKMEKELDDVQESNRSTIEIIQEQTIDLVAAIEETRDTINLEFKMAIS